MSGVSPVVAALIIAICSQLLIVAPVAFLALRTWLQVKINSMELTYRPTHEQVSQRLDNKIHQLLTQDGINRETNGLDK